MLPLMLVLAMLSEAERSNAASFYTTRPDDPKAVYLTPDHFPVHADGKGDDTDALQAAIDKVADTDHQGIVFVPGGIYRMSKTVYVWEGVRLIGYGANRPKFVLADNTPGYQEMNPYQPDVPESGNYMLHFVSGKPKGDGKIRDANPGTFYSALSNIDIEIGAGNPAAIGVRFHIAQHCYIAHVDFHIGSGKAGMQEGGNEIEDCHFYGGDCGIVTGKTAPSWPFLIIDSSFEGQRAAGIESSGGGSHARARPVQEYAQCNRGATGSPGHHLDQGQQLHGYYEAGDCHRAGDKCEFADEHQKFALCECPGAGLLRDTGKKVAGTGAVYRVVNFCHGLQVVDGSGPEIKTSVDMGAVDTTASQSQCPRTNPRASAMRKMGEPSRPRRERRRHDRRHKGDPGGH